MQWLKKIFNRNSAPKKVTTLERTYKHVVEDGLLKKPHRRDIPTQISRPTGVILLAERYKDTNQYDIYTKYARYNRVGYQTVREYKAKEYKNRCHANVPYSEMIQILEDYDAKAAFEAVPEDLRPHPERVQDYIKDNVEHKRKRDNVKRVHARQAKKGKFQH